MTVEGVISSKYAETAPDGFPEFGYHPTATLKIFLTDECDNTCKGCFMACSPKSFIGRKPPGRITFSEGVDLIRQAKMDFGMELIEFSGGEPTLELNDLINLVKFAKDIGCKTRLVTNGSIIGRCGKYSSMLEKYLPDDLKKYQPAQVVSMLKTAGLDSVLLSVDTMHNVDSDVLNQKDVYPSQIPIYVISNAIRLLLENDFGSCSGVAGRMNLSLKIGVTASGVEYEPSFDLVREAIELCGTDFKCLGKDGRYQIWENLDKKKIYVHRNSTGSIGSGKFLNETELTALGNTVYERSCYVFDRRSEAIARTGGVHQEICVYPDGEVSTCAYRSHLIGNFRTHSLSEIIDYVNNPAIDSPDKYQLSVDTLRLLFSIASDTDGSRVWGEAYRRIVASDPSLKTLVESFSSHISACGALGKSDILSVALKKTSNAL